MTAEIMRNFQDKMSCSFAGGQIQNDEGFAVLGYMQEHYSNLTLADWKRILWIRMAENMLLNTKMTMNEISLALGYENTETFIRLFRKELHITPGKYREQVQNHAL